MLQLSQTVRILLDCQENAQSVSQVVARLDSRYETTIALIKELEARRLLRVTPEKNGVGRPRHSLRTTPLGKQFIEQYNVLSNIRLQSNDNDIKKALKHAEETQRLLDLGVNPYRRFWEVNQIARNIASTAQISRHP